MDDKQKQERIQGAILQGIVDGKLYRPGHPAEDMIWDIVQRYDAGTMTEEGAKQEVDEILTADPEWKSE